MNQNQQIIYDFIERTFSTDSFDRIQEFNLMSHKYGQQIYNNFADYDDFMQHQLYCINNLDDNEVDQILVICSMIENNKICLCDEETCAEFTANTIYWQRCFDNYGNLDPSKNTFTIMNPR